MADQNPPNSAAEKDKAEGERQPGEDVTTRYDVTRGGAGISNRPVDEEVANQDALPERGEEKKA